MIYIPPVASSAGSRGRRKAAFALSGGSLKTSIYVDGFNLYYGCLKDTPYRWLDLAALCRNTLAARHTVAHIRYFTAKVQPTPGDPNVPVRQNLYLRALRTIPNLTIHEGHFLSHPRWMPLYFPDDDRRPGPPLSPKPTEAKVILDAPSCSGSVWRKLAPGDEINHLALKQHPAFARILRFEEKGSDVNLATYLLVDGFRGNFECAVVVSNDSDLTEPIKVIRKDLNLPVGVINPHPKPAVQLKHAAKFFLQVSPEVLQKSQFPKEVRDDKGRTIRKPDSW